MIQKTVGALLAAMIFSANAFAAAMDAPKLSSEETEIERLQALVQRRMPDMVELAKRAELEPQSGRQSFQYPLTDPTGTSRMLLRFLHAREEIPPYGCDRESSFEDNSYLMTVLEACPSRGECSGRVALWLLESNGQAMKVGGPALVVSDADAKALSGGRLELKLDGETAVDFRVEGKRQALDESQLFSLLKSAHEAGNLDLL